MPPDPAGAHARRPRRWARLAPVLLPFALLLGSGLRGVDFGTYWDERLQIAAVRRAVHRGEALPQWYHYPSTSFWLTAAPLVPEALGLALAGEGAYGVEGWPATSARLEARVEAEDYRLRARRVFVALGSLVVLWVYLLVLRWRGWLPALVAASLVAGSWELGYHLRWIAPDAVLAQFAALALLGTTATLRAERGRAGPWLVLAAAAAGAAASTKYPGGLLLAPVLVAAWTRCREHRARRLGAVVGLFAAAYFAITPGTLLEPVRFWQDLTYELRHYGALGHYGFTVEPGAAHLGLILRYALGELLAPWDALAWALAALALVGAVAAWRERPALGLVLVGTPVAYALWFAEQRVLFVRNLLVLLPFLAVLAARGAELVAGALRPRALRTAFALGLAGALLANAAWQVRAAESIRERGSGRSVRELAAHLRAHPDRRYRLTLEVAAAMAALGEALPANATTEPPGETGEAGATPDALVFFNTGADNEGAWESNRPGFAEAVFGPRDVNFDWYTYWPQRYVLVVAPEVARAMGMTE